MCVMPSKMLTTQEDSGVRHQPSTVNHAHFVERSENLWKKEGRLRAAG